MPRIAGSAAAHPLVLVADDNHDIANSLVQVVQAMGYDAVAAYGGREAVRWCEALHPKLLILDVNMPLCNGCEAAREIRDAAWCPAFIAAHTALEPGSEPLKSGRLLFDEVLTKPLDFDDLQRLLRQAFDH